ncbi:MAG TPA: response regulator [Pirellulales bacterium]|jgi:two-component system chemotaxis sensor kinase CheA|nr:response regulator [Pirellulales bacterium]
MDINQQLLSAFKVEHVEHLEGIRSCLAQWQQDGGTPDVNEAFRRAHSLKGAARVTGLLPIEALAHQLESLFAALRAKPQPIDGEVLHAVRAALDTIEDAASALLAGRQPPDASQLLAELNALLAGESAPQPRPQREAGPIATRVAGPKAATHAAAVQAPETVRLSTENLDRLLLSTSQLLTESLKQDSLARELGAIQQQLAVVQREWESLKRTTAGPLRRLSDSPELSGLASYIDLVEHEFGGLTRRIRGARLLQQRSSWSVRLLSEQLQADVRHARMVPAESEFQVFRKMLRDLASDQQKELEFRASGFDVLADRMVLQALKDPLMHVLRNAVTHGIESPEERSRRGKSPAGLVTLIIRTVGKRLTIEIEDDGCGIDLAGIAELAIERGMLSSAEAAGKSASELTELLFQPGFSTSRTVTELAGRGMGLSAAYEAVNRLQGQIELRPRAEGGTSILIAMPLSISTHRLLLVDCRGQTLAIPFYGIEALHHVKVQDVESVEGIPMAALGGQLTPLASLADLVDDSHTGVDVAAHTLCLAVLRSNSKRVAVVVDAFAAEQNALIQNLGPPADTMRLYLGGILLEDGSVSPVLNPAELVDRFKPSKKTAVARPQEPEHPRQTATVLVVDDSFTTRTLETSILEANGFRVRVAVDGIEALELLRAEKMDLVISDIQMPRLDGFGLLEAVKRDPRLARIPVIIVSSVDGSEDQARGLRLGADAYIVKRRFDHQELLKVVRQVL